RTLEGHSNVVENVALSPDSGLVASIDAGGTLKLWNVQDGTLRWSITAEFSNLNLVRFAPDGLTIATSGGDKIVRLWRVADGSLIRELAGHSLPVQGIDFSPDGQLLISTGWDRLLQVWRVSDGLLVGRSTTCFRDGRRRFLPTMRRWQWAHRDTCASGEYPTARSFTFSRITPPTLSRSDSPRTAPRWQQET